MSSAPIGIMDAIDDRKRALHRVSKARGMSAAALARLPKLTRYEDPFDCRPALATGRDATQTRMQNLARIRHRPSVALNQAIKKEPIEREGSRIVGEIPEQKTARAKAIAGVVAVAAGLDGAHQLLAYKAPRRVAQAKHVAILLAAQFSDLSVKRLAEIFRYGCPSSGRFAVQKARYMLRAGRPDIVSLHDRALVAIKARWPEYAK